MTTATPHVGGGEPILSTTVGRIAPMFEEAREAGVALREELPALGLPADLAEGPSDTRISLADFYRIQHRLMVLMGDETCKASSRHLMPGSTDFVLAHIGECANIYEVMRVIAHSYNLLHGGQYNFVRKTPAGVEYVIDDHEFPYSHDRDGDYVGFLMECTCIFLHCMLMLASPGFGKENVVALSVRRPRGRDDVRHLQYWRAPIRFGAPRYVLRFDEAAALRPIAPLQTPWLTSHALYLKIVEAVSESGAEPPPPLCAAERVREALAKGWVEQPAIAARIGVSVATLRRRLQEEAVSFREIRRAALNDAAKRLLADGRSVPDVAEELGFAEFRSFNRAFKDWNGVTPAAFRRTAGGP
ncbi:MAG: AraC family transcriptional regulator [Caulobacterales bacterium]|nr:AraC family transcriptional regulator [Caulobacterales bacterium]